MTSLSQDIKPLAYSKTLYQGIAADEIELPDYVASAYTTNRSSRPQIQLHVNKISRKNRDFWRRTLEDIKNTPLRWILCCFFSHILPLLGICVLSILLATVSNEDLIFNTGPYSICQLNGTFSLTYEQYNPWSREQMFAINIQFGNYGFSSAKLIDIFWDIVSLLCVLASITSLKPFRLSEEEAKPCLLFSHTKFLLSTCHTKWKRPKFPTVPSKQ